MKTPEDEAFDELATRQGDWGSGFQVKPQKAADKLQEPPSEWEGIKAILDEYGLQAIDFVADFKEALAQTVQEPVARVSGTYGGRFVYDPINRVVVLPVGMALYAMPAKREWVGLTDEDLLQIRETVQVVEGRSLLQSLTKAIEQALKEKNT